MVGIKWSKISYVCTGILIFLLSACSNTRFLGDDEILYTGIKEVKIIPQGEIPNLKSLESSLYWSAYIKPNNSFYLPRRILPPVRLWVYNYMETDKQRGLKSWIFRNFSERPVLVSNINPQLRAGKLEKELFNAGHFGVKVDHELIYKPSNPKKAMVRYNVILPAAYHYSSVDFSASGTLFDAQLQQAATGGNIAAGDQYNLKALVSEQERISRSIRDSGYFYFRKDQIAFLADTTLGESRIDLAGSIRKPLPPKVQRSYTLGRISVFLKNSENDSLHAALSDSLTCDSIVYFYDELFMDPMVLSQAIYFRPGDKYQDSKHDHTRRHLANFAVFNSITIRYSIMPTDSSQLAMQVFLSPIEKVSLSAEVNMLSKSSGFSGPAIEGRLSDANLLGGAEKLNLSLKGAFEWEIGNDDRDSYLGPNSYEIGVNLGLHFPKIIAPFGLSRITNVYVPKTSVNAGFEILNRVQNYKMNSFAASYRYQWKSSAHNNHQLSLPDLNIVNLIDTTPAFSEIYRNNPLVSRSFEEQTILSLRYRYSYDNQAISHLKNNIAWESGLVVAAPYAKFVKITQDFRYYINLKRKSSLVNRFYAGLGYTFGDSNVMPFVEQFFSGGANSVRGFSARSLGPGTFLGDTLLFHDQTGDIKLEYNLEFRYRLGERLFGALFLDIGNIWLKDEDPQRPGSQFKFHSFYKEFAFGTGLGLRFDLDYFVVRMDLGIALRDPGYQKGAQRIFENKEVTGVKLYLAIGYPF
jgi:outer membrane protein assembly factor BamA